MLKLKYFKYPADGSKEREITYEDALEIVAGSYGDTDLVHDMLTIANYIPCRFSTIVVMNVTDGHRLVPMAGLQFLVPDGMEYDDDGNRITGDVITEEDCFADDSFEDEPCRLDDDYTTRDSFEDELCKTAVYDDMLAYHNSEMGH